MALPLTALQPDYSRRRRTRRYSTLATGNYVTGGVALDLSTILNPHFYGDVFMGTIPLLEQLSVEMPAGYTAMFVPGTDQTSLATAWKLKIFTAPDTELAAAAFPASLLADSIFINVDQPAWS